MLSPCTANRSCRKEKMSRCLLEITTTLFDSFCISRANLYRCTKLAERLCTMNTFITVGSITFFFHDVCKTVALECYANGFTLHAWLALCVYWGLLAFRVISVHKMCWKLSPAQPIFLSDVLVWSPVYYATVVHLMPEAIFGESVRWPSIEMFTLLHEGNKFSEAISSFMFLFLLTSPLPQYFCPFCATAYLITSFQISFLYWALKEVLS